MIEKLIQFALSNRLLTAVAFFGVACMGVWSMLNISVDSFPDVSNVQVQIMTEPESMATEEIEKLITIPIETGMNGLPNITKIRSNSSFGMSAVTVVFEDNTDVYWARNVVNERLTTIELPAGAPRPTLGPVLSTFSNVYDYYLVSDRHDFTELRTIQDWQVARRLRSVHGVGNVVSCGGFVKQYQVYVSPQALKSYGLTLKEVNNSLASNNVNAGGNFIVQGGEEVIIRGLGLIESVTDIENIVLKQVNGVPIKVGKVAHVEIGPAFRRGSATMNGKGEVVTGMVLTRKGVNTKAVVAEVRKEIEKIRPDLPEGVSLHAYYDQTELVDKTIETVKEILLFSGGLVIIVLFALLLNIPSALIVSVIIPLSLLFSFVLMKLTGLSANLMTLGAVDFGVVVDAGVVMVENIFRHLSEASAGGRQVKDRWNLILNAARAVARPIVFAIAIVIAVYLPLFTLEGVEGKMFIPLALTFIYALVGALLCALLLIPILCFWFMRGNVVEKQSPVVTVFRKIRNPALCLALKHPKRTIVICCVALAGACCLMPFLGSEFIPTLDEGSILLRTKQAPSISHVESQRINTIVEQSLVKFPEVETVVTKIGRAGMEGDLEGVDNADIFVGLKPKSEWKTTQNKEELVNKMAKELDEIPGLMYSFSQPVADMIDDLIAGIKADLGIKIFGDDLQTVDHIATEIEGIVHDVRGSADVQREHVLGLPQINIKLNRNVIARYGLNVADIQEIIQTALAGKIVTEVLEGTKRFGLLVSFPYQLRDTASDIESIPVETADGARIPLKSLATITKARGTVVINREDGQRRTAVLANVRGRDLGSFVQECQARINTKVHLPKGYYIVYGGQFENEQRAMRKLAIVVPVVLLLIFVLLFASFNSLKNAGLIMLNVPFAMIGGIVALFLSRQPLSVPAIIGFIALFGVAVQNGVIMVSYIMQLQQRGLRVKHAAIEGAKVRLRPVAMTAMVAIMGLLPKIFSTGTGAEVQRPLAIVVLGGLVTATALTLIVLPTLYTMLNKDDDHLSDGGD